MEGIHLLPGDCCSIFQYGPPEIKYDTIHHFLHRQPCRSVGFGPNVNNLLGLFWRLVSYYGWHVHLAWVSSENNISDKVSRQDASDMPDIQAEHLHFDLQPMFKILCRTVKGLWLCPRPSTSRPSPTPNRSYICAARVVMVASAEERWPQLDSCEVNHHLWQKVSGSA